MSLICRGTGAAIILTLMTLVKLPSSSAEIREINGCVIEPGTDCTHVETGLKYKDLNGVDLSGANLSGITLHGSSLRGANLRGANLRGTEFDMAVLTDADLSEADLTDAYLSLSIVTNINLQGAILTNVDLRYAQGIDSANLEGAQFCHTTLPGGIVRNDHC
ncbi:pentapeptide repeat-containing protein [Leptolyngbya sp. PCC 6406]|uniref:pentapeptide repeat-containing protein n=1 Tax=Leptolyngbya sp. PCC 6406 TaxID=1173264 RepID=UPI001CED7DB7|nr:pentapeptide repeat-containing protein [Leptolyngbya sp. PCC 6406]